MPFSAACVLYMYTNPRDRKGGCYVVSDTLQSMSTIKPTSIIPLALESLFPNSILYIYIFSRNLLEKNRLNKLTVQGIGTLMVIPVHGEIQVCILCFDVRVL